MKVPNDGHTSDPSASFDSLWDSPKGTPNFGKHTFWGVPIVRVIALSGLYWGLLCWETTMPLQSGPLANTKSEWPLEQLACAALGPLLPRHTHLWLFKYWWVSASKHKVLGHLGF